MADPTQAIPPPALIGTGQEGLGDVVTLNALNQLTQGQAQQPAPTAPSLRPNLPAIVRLIADMHSAGRANVPTNAAGQINVQQAPMRPHSRLDAFENFLGNFATSLAAGLGAAHGYGAFGKGFAAAAVAPQQQAITQFGLQREAALTQAQQQEQLARTQLTQTQAQLAPQQLAATMQLREATLAYEQWSKQQYYALMSRNIGVKEKHEDWNESFNERRLDLQKDIETGKLGVQQFLAKYSALDKMSQIATRAAVVDLGHQKLAQAQEALNQFAQLRSAQAYAAAKKAADEYSLVAPLANAMFPQDAGVQFPQLTIPAFVPSGGGASNIPKQQSKGGNVVNDLASQYK